VQCLLSVSDDAINLHVLDMLYHCQLSTADMGDLSGWYVCCALSTRVELLWLLIICSVVLLQTYLYNDLFLYNIKTGDWSLLKAPNAPAPRCSHQVRCGSYAAVPILLDFTSGVHCSLFTICGDACPLSCVNAEAFLRGWPNAWDHSGGKLVNAAQLLLINEAFVNICWATLLSSELVSPACVQVWSSNLEVGHVGLVERDPGRRGYWVTLYLYIYTARLLVSLFL